MDDMAKMRINEPELNCKITKKYSRLVSKLGYPSTPSLYHISKMNFQRSSASCVTTKRQLSEAIQAVRPAAKCSSGSRFESRSGNASIVGEMSEMDEVYPHLYVGDIGAAHNVDYLKKVGITHVLNTAHGDSFGSVDTNAELYEKHGIKYMSLDLNDMPTVNIAKYFDVSAQFLEDALHGGGQALVHCFMGISRSATIACAFLMIKRGLTAVEALQQLRKNRYVCPNDGFLVQLAELDNNLMRERTEP